METAILFLAAGLAYAVSFGIAFTGKPDTGRIRVSFHVALGGFAAHTAAMTENMSSMVYSPLSACAASPTTLPTPTSWTRASRPSWRPS